MLESPICTFICKWYFLF